MALTYLAERTAPVRRDVAVRDSGIQKTTLVRGGHVVSLDESVGDLPCGDVLIEGDTIVAVGPSLDATGATVVDASGKVVIPGLIDSHRHVWQGAIGGRMSPDGCFGLVLADLPSRYEPEDIYAGVLWGALQAINSGVTMVADWSHVITSPAHADENVRALRDSGIRSLFLYGPPIGEDVMKWFAETTEPHPADVRRIRTEQLFDDDARVTMGLALRGPEFSSPDITRLDFGLARELAVPISVHSGPPAYLATSRTVRTLDRLGLLGPDVHHAHGAQLSDDDLARIAGTGGSITPCPTADTSMALGTYPITGRAVAHGLQPALGSDLVSGVGDMFGEMRTAMAAERSRAGANGWTALPATTFLDERDVLRFCTVAGAAAWGMSDRIGTITPGKRADLAVIDVSRHGMILPDEAVRTVVFHADADDVDTVLVNGDVVKHDGRLVGPIAEEAHALIKASRRRMFTRTNLVDVLVDVLGGSLAG